MDEKNSFGGIACIEERRPCVGPLAYMLALVIRDVVCDPAVVNSFGWTVQGRGKRPKMGWTMGWTWYTYD